MKVMQLCVGMVGTNCYVVYDEQTRDAVVIDPGDNAVSILQTVEREKLTVHYVLLTHAHFDHILAAHDVLRATGAKYVVPAKDEWLLQKEEMGEFRSFAKHYIPDTPDVLAKEGTRLLCGSMEIQYMETPGHTPGSCVIRIGDCLFTGDTLFHHECGRCDLKGGDFSQMLRSLKRLSELPGDYRVLPGHEGISTLSEERLNNPYMLQASAG